MRAQEVRCFAWSLNCSVEQIEVADLIGAGRSADRLTRARLDQVDAVLVGGSGDYSVAKGGPWLSAALDVMAELAGIGKPTFASCWGFQAMAQALGGQVIHDPSNAELGTLPITLTEQGRADAVFGCLVNDADDECGSFLAVMGHEDHVVQLPGGAEHLAFSQRVPLQAFRLAGQPIYATQFHPELDTSALLERLETYPRYVESFAGEPFDVFAAKLRATPESSRLLSFFVDHVFK